MRRLNKKLDFNTVFQLLNAQFNIYQNKSRKKVYMNFSYNSKLEEENIK